MTEDENNGADDTKPADVQAVPAFDVEEITTELAAKLASRSRHVCLFLGAGAGKAAGLPDLSGLQESIVDKLDGDDAKVVAGLLEKGNLEEVLSLLRRIQSLLEEGETFRDFTGEEASRLDSSICRAVIESVDIAQADLESFVRLASWAARSDYLAPLEIFTVNYDLLLEAGLDEVGCPYFDGFVGNIRARFRADLVQPSSDNERLPSFVLRLWKLHGATNWAFEGPEDQRKVVRLGSSAAPEQAAAIYPSEAKYDDSRRVPFVVLMDRFRRAVTEPETIIIVSGYSFGDQHLNEILFDAAKRHQRSEIVVLCFESIPEAVATESLRTRNITVLSKSEAIRGGVRQGWRDAEDIPGVFEGSSFLLGDFAAFATFLAQTGRTEDV